MKKTVLSLCMMGLSLLLPMAARAAVADYDAAAALENAKADIANWQSYLPDDVYVAHVSIPGTHDTATAEGWKSSTGPTYSTTQSATIDEQLAAGIRAFDFRPGMVSGELWCNHGTDQTKLKLADAFTKLKDYLDAHPGEFFVMHLFRGNIYRTGEASTGNKFLGAKDDAASQQKYNELMGQLFNEGQFADYFIDYTPYLKVKDMRGKIVVFRRDRIDFTHIAKAGNLGGWVGAEELWSENSRVGVVNASDATVSGTVRATDVSSPDNDGELETELNSMSLLFSYNCNLLTPNELKKENVAYKPDWTMIFTSGAFNGENTAGYLKNAEHTNPHFTGLIKDSWTSGKTGPTGTVFSDWVLTDSHSYSGTTYATMGVELVPTIIENNFHYIKDYILDDELFAKPAAENFWPDGKEYYMRNVATGLFLSSGQWWGTHATLGAYGLKVRPAFDENTGTFRLATSLGTNTAYGENDYVDNGDSHLNLLASRAGSGIFTFTTLDGTKAIAAAPTEGWLDGTEWTVFQADYAEGDPTQQWELIPVEGYLEKVAADASLTNGVDVSFAIGRWRQNDSEACNSWGVSKGKSANGGFDGQTGDTDNKLILYFSNAKKGSFAFGWDAKWSVSKDITGLPNGIYTLVWDGLVDNINDLTMTVNGTAVANLVKSAGSNGNTSRLAAAQKFQTGEYECVSPQFTVTDNTVQIRITNKTHSSATAAAFDNFRLIYYGPDPAVTCDFLRKVIADATAKAQSLAASQSEGWDEAIAPYQAMVDAQSVVGDGTREADAIYAMLRERVYMNTEAGADYTAAIVNNSFEFGDSYGWIVEDERGDTGVKPNSNATYAMDNCDGDYMFNTWDGDTWGSAIMQTVGSLPAGRYRLEALLASDAGAALTLIAGASSATVEATGKGHGEEAAVEFELAETGDLMIAVQSAERWYKADNFRLTYLGEASTHIAWTMGGSVYDTLILPFDADVPEGLELYTADGVTDNAAKQYHVLVLTQAYAIEANKPYVVKLSDDATPATRSAGAVYEFAGIPQDGGSDSYTHGVLTGTLAGTAAAAGDYVVRHDGDRSMFVLNDSGDAAGVEANHAYISGANAGLMYNLVHFEKPHSTTGVDSVVADSALPVSVYTTMGVCVRRDVPAAEALDGLDAGVYIVTDGERTLKVRK